MIPLNLFSLGTGTSGALGFVDNAYIYVNDGSTDNEKGDIGYNEDTQIIRIEYSSKNPELVQKIVDGIVDEFSILSQEMVPNVTIKVIETAEAPMQTAENGGKVYIAIGFMFGFMVSLGIIFILDYMDTTLRTKEQIEKEFNSNKVEEFLTEAKETVDYIIIDTPSLETFVDAQIMAMKADGVILVTDSKNTKR